MLGKIFSLYLVFSACLHSNALTQLSAMNQCHYCCYILLYFIFTQDSLVSFRETVINEGPAMEVLIVFKAPMWATGYRIMYSISAQLDNHQFYYSISLAECLTEWINYHFLCLWYDPAGD